MHVKGQCNHCRNMCCLWHDNDAQYYYWCIYGTSWQWRQQWKSAVNIISPWTLSCLGFLSSNALSSLLCVPLAITMMMIATEASIKWAAAAAIAIVLRHQWVWCEIKNLNQPFPGLAAACSWIHLIILHEVLPDPIPCAPYLLLRDPPTEPAKDCRVIAKWKFLHKTQATCPI